MREDSKKLELFVIRKNLILQLLFQALQKYITRFWTKSLFLFFHDCSTAPMEFRWWKKTKPLSKKIPFLMHVVHLCKILARYKYSSWGYEDCDMRASLERRLLGRIVLCCERDLVTDAIKSRSLLFHQENLHKIANMNVFCSHLLLFWAILWLGSVTVVHKTLLLNGMSVSKGSRKDSFQVLVATRWTARKDFTVVVTKHWSIKL